ncbi:hypothetical protein [Anaerorhabdus furcosa]|uniref:Lipoprotein n=1 Tax=Anaerorhabdus furcosa TaxID=118967 RepID=A0A1T4P6U2_9FIRM|nr:hypothetical protein [Anaerorhabdus furcosa]SJZ86926.1 hypothetical protein SAMN02745191_1898 [Anaerorhabdus furcosa]
MKRFCLILVACLLFGCAQSTQPLEERIQSEFEFVNTLKTVDGDNRKDFYSYYIEPSVGRVSSNPSNNIFLKDGVQFVMNLNVSKIISEKYYTDALTGNDVATKDNLLFEIEGQYDDSLLNSYDYRCQVYQYENMYMLLLETQYMNFYTVANANQLPTIAGEMLKIARTIRVNQEEIISAYSSKEAIQYKKEALNLFEVAVPENGRVDEMITDKTNTGDSTGDNAGGMTDDFYQSDDFGSKIPTASPTQDPNGDYASDDFGTE